MSSKAAFVMINEDLFNIQRLCFKYGRINLADWAEYSLEVYCLDREKFYSSLESPDWWRNYFSLRDMNLCAPDRSLSQTECLTDNELLQRCLTGVYEETSRAGKEHPGIMRAVETFRSRAERDTNPTNH